MFTLGESHRLGGARRGSTLPGGSTLRTGVRWYAKVGVTLAAASLVAVTSIAPRPSAPRPSGIYISSPAIRLIDAESILNIPVNLFDDVINVPYNYVQAANQTADSLFFTGTWWVPSSVNLWGEDPGDPTHFESLFNLMIPIPAFSNALGEQLSGLADAELPVSASCDATSCVPFVPITPITGISFLDRDIWFGQLFSDPQASSLVSNFFQVPLFGPDSLTSGYTFGNVVDPSGIAYSGFGIPGTTAVDVNGVTEYLMPWSNTTFTLNPLLPFEDFINSLTQTPTGIEIPSIQDIIQAPQSDLAGLFVDFYPFVPGGMFCPGACTSNDLLGFTAENWVKDILALDPQNQTTQQWLTDVANGTANGPTPEDIAVAEQQADAGLFTLNPSTLAQVDTMLAQINPMLPGIAADTGFLAPYDPQAVMSDIGDVLGINQALASLPTAPDLSTILDPTLIDLQAAFSDPTQLLALLGL